MDDTLIDFGYHFTIFQYHAYSVTLFIAYRKWQRWILIGCGRKWKLDSNTLEREFNLYNFEVVVS